MKYDSPTHLAWLLSLHEMDEFNLRIEGQMKGDLILWNVEILRVRFLFYYPTICLKTVK